MNDTTDEQETRDVTDSFFTVSKGGPAAEDDIPNGVYPVMLTELKDPHSVDVTRGPKAGQTMELIDWIFVIDAPNTPLHERPIEGSTSTASGPKSKAFAWITALLGGQPPKVGQQFAKGDLVGRVALATIDHGETGDGWPRIASLGAIPPQMLAQQVATATGTPLAGIPAVGPAAPTIAQQVAAVTPATGPGGDLPF
jgi:hypothetical protein